ncbi:MAG: beta-3-deoxy-D-manno-oct-2-ulosonic acid transferase [Lautropia sp.]
MRDTTRLKAIGFSLRKRRYLRAFLPEYRIAFVDDHDSVRAGDAVAVWASNPSAQALASRDDVSLLRVEDGFLRSVGLGVALTRPLSWVVDRRGMHFDAGNPSDIEHLLANTQFEPALVERARALRACLVASRLSKYNLGTSRWRGLSVARPSGGRAVLVCGQVERDASLRLGAPSVNRNIDLLRAARALHPSDWVVYKPHPDVVAGLRGAGADESRASAFADEVVADAPICDLIDAVDVVHVMTSLTGFEALLRDKEVHCHGVPFYAGWGLTRDHEPVPRRTRRVSLDELTAAALILYPRYLDPDTGKTCTPERAIEALIAWRGRDDGQPPWWVRLFRPVLRHA